MNAVTARLAVTVVLATCARLNLLLAAGVDAEGAASLLGVSLGLLTLFERETVVTAVTAAMPLGEERLTLAGRALTPLALAVLVAGVEGFLMPLTLGARDGVFTGLVSRGLVVGAADCIERTDRTERGLEGGLEAGERGSGLMAEVGVELESGVSGVMAAAVMAVALSEPALLLSALLLCSALSVSSTGFKSNDSSSVLRTVRSMDCTTLTARSGK